MAFSFSYNPKIKSAAYTFTIPATLTAATLTDNLSDVAIPTGAYVTRIFYHATTAPAAITSVALYVGPNASGTAICAAVALASLPGYSTNAAVIAETVENNYLTTGGKLNLAALSTGGTTTGAGVIKVTVEYYIP